MDIINALGNIGFDWQITVANIINFALVYFVLNKLVFDKLNNVLEERKERITGGLQQADEAKILKEKASNEREDILRDARSEASQIVASARSKENEIIDGSAKKAQIAADEIVASAQQRVLNEHEEMIKSFKNEAAELVVIASQKLATDKLLSQDDYHIAGDILRQSSLSESSKLSN